MPDFSKRIIYLSDAQRQELFTNGTITVDGVTITYSDNDIYVTPQSAPVTDVQVNGTSIVSQGVANVPVASSSVLGAIKVGSGLLMRSDSTLSIFRSYDGEIKSGTELNRPIVPECQERATFYGLAKVAGADQKNSPLPTGQYTETAKNAIKKMIGIGEALTLREWGELGEDTNLIEIPLPEKYSKIFIRFHGRINNANNDLQNAQAYNLAWLGNSSTFDTFVQYNSIYFPMYVRTLDTYMTKLCFDVNYPYIERYCTDAYGATNWSAGSNWRSVGGSYNTDTEKLSSYPTSLFIRPYEQNNGYLYKANSKLCVYAVL